MVVDIWKWGCTRKNRSCSRMLVLSSKWRKKLLGCSRRSRLVWSRSSGNRRLEWSSRRSRKVWSRS